MTQSEFTTRRDELYLTQARTLQELQIMEYQYIEANRELTAGTRVQYPTTTYTSEGIVKSTETAVFTGKCEISSNGAILYELLPDGVVGRSYLERNLFEVVRMTPKQTRTVANISVGLIIATFFTLCIWVIVTAIRDLIN